MANRYFIDGSNNNWSTSDNWSASSGGAGGETVPTLSDAVFLDTNSPSCNVDAIAECLSLDCTGYTNTLTIAGSNSLYCYGSLTFVATMTFIHNNNIVRLNNDSTLTTNGITFGKLNIWNDPANTITLADNVTCTDKIYIYGSGARTVTLNGNQLIAKGDFQIGASTIVIGTAALLINGAGDQIFTGNNGSSAYYLSLSTTVNKPSGTLTLAGTFLTWKDADFIVTAGTVDASAFTMGFGGTGEVNVTATFLGFDFWNGCNKTLSSNLTCTGNIGGNTSGSTILTTAGSEKTISFGGDFMLGVTYYESGTGVKFIVNGTDNQQITSSSANRRLNPELEINKASGTFTFGGAQELSFCALTHTTGATAVTQTVRFYTGNFDTDGIDFTNVNIWGLSVLTSALTVQGLLKINTNTNILNANGHQINCYSLDNIIGGTFTHGNNTVVIDKPNGTSTIDGNFTFYNFTCQIAGLTLEFDNTATVIVSNDLTLVGANGNDLVLVSDSPTNQWGLTWNGAVSSISYVNVTDSDASAGNVIDADNGTNTNGGNNQYWIFSANRYFVTGGGVDSNWSTDSNWSQTDGGASDGVVPTASNLVFFTTNSPVCTIDASAVALSLDCSGYTGTLTQAHALAVSGNITLVAGMTYTPGVHTVTIDGTSTLTSGGKAFYNLTLAETVTLTDVLDVNNILSIGNTATLDAAGFQINVQNWNKHNDGIFTHGNNKVVIDKASGTATIDGDTIFYNFECQIAGLTIEFQNTATIIVSNDLTLVGADGNDLVLVSDSSPNQWTLTWNGSTSSISYVKVTDSDASAGTEIDASNGTNTDNGNNLNWTFINPAPSGKVWFNIDKMGM